jgi:hypothetical protein
MFPTLGQKLGSDVAPHGLQSIQLFLLWRCARARFARALS